MEFSFPLNGINNDLDTSIFVAEPVRITNYISDLISATMQSQKIFTPVGTTGGAFIFNQATTGAKASEPGLVSPGGEFPVANLDLGEDVTVRVQKAGEKFFVTDEALKRNDASVFQRGSRLVANAMVDSIDAAGFKAVKDALDKLGKDALTVTSTGWTAALDTQASAKTAKTGEGAVLDNLIDATALLESDGRSYMADTLVYSARDEANLKKLFGVNEYKAVLESLGFSNVIKLNNLPEGTAYVLQSGVVGVMGVESPISTEQWREHATQREWFQTWATLGFGVTDPQAIVKIEGINK